MKYLVVVIMSNNIVKFLNLKKAKNLKHIKVEEFKILLAQEMNQNKKMFT